MSNRRFSLVLDDEAQAALKLLCMRAAEAAIAAGDARDTPSETAIILAAIRDAAACDELHEARATLRGLYP